MRWEIKLLDLTFPQKNPFGPENQNVGVKCSIKNIVQPNEIGRPNHHSKSCWGGGGRGYSLQRMICESQNITKSDFRRPLLRYRLHFDEGFVHLYFYSLCWRFRVAPGTRPTRLRPGRGLVPADLTPPGSSVAVSGDDFHFRPRPLPSRPFPPQLPSSPSRWEEGEGDGWPAIYGDYNNFLPCPLVVSCPDRRTDGVVRRGADVRDHGWMANIV